MSWSAWRAGNTAPFSAPWPESGAKLRGGLVESPGAILIACDVGMAAYCKNGIAGRGSHVPIPWNDHGGRERTRESRPS